MAEEIKQDLSKSAKRRLKQKSKDSGLAKEHSDDIEIASSGFVSVLKRAMKDLTIGQRPERTYYALDLCALAELFMSFDSYVRLQPRRGGWFQQGYYAGSAWFAFAAKLQRIGEATEQISVPGAELLQVSNMELPAVIQLFIDQFGVKIDSQGVELMPLVSDELICAVVSYANKLMTAGPDNAAAVQTDSAKEVMRRGYGARWYTFLCVAKVAAVLDVPFTKKDASADGIKIAWFSIVTVQRLFAANQNIGGADVNALLPAQASPVEAYFALGGAAPAVGGYITAAINQAVAGVIADMVTNNDPFANFGPYGNLNGHTRIPAGSVRWQSEQFYLGQIFPLRSVSTSVDGSFAPLVHAYDDDGLGYGESVVSGISPAEWVLGVTLGLDQYLCDGNGTIFNVSSLNRRKMRNSCGHLYASIDDLRAAAWRDGMVKRGH